MTDKEAIRLNKYLSDSGVCSRREADRLIESGSVKVDGVRAVMGMKIFPNQTVIVKGKKIVPRAVKVLLAYNKPRGVVCTSEKRKGVRNIEQAVNYKDRVYPIGRLDKESEGLILLTNNGDIVNRILRGSNNHDKEYIVKVDREITEDFLKRMSEGVHILDTVTKPCKVSRIGKYTFRIILTQGLNRQIRRMCEVFSYKVVELRRVRIMNIELGGLKVGEYRVLSDQEMQELDRLLIGSTNLPAFLKKEQINEE